MISEPSMNVGYNPFPTKCPKFIDIWWSAIIAKNWPKIHYFVQNFPLENLHKGTLIRVQKTWLKRITEFLLFISHQKSKNKKYCQYWWVFMLMDIFKSNQTSLSDFLCLNKSNLKRVYGYTLKCYTLIGESVCLTWG